MNPIEEQAQQGDDLLDQLSKYLPSKLMDRVNDALAATGKQQVGDLPDDVVARCRALPTDELLDCALEVYARSCRYGTKGQHDAAMAYKDEIIRRIDGCAAQVGEVQGDARAQFEAWAVSIGASIDTDEHGNYLSSALNYSKLGWDAALAARQPGAHGWSGWATQKPGHMPKLWGAREIADLNHDPDGDARLIFLSEQTVPTAGYVLIQIADAKALCAHVKHSQRSALSARRVASLIDRKEKGL